MNECSTVSHPITNKSPMAAILSTLMRGLLGIAATIVLVGVVWSVYANRAPIISAGEFMIGMFTTREQHRTAPATGVAREPSVPAVSAPAPAPSDTTTETTH